MDGSEFTLAIATPQWQELLQMRVSGRVREGVLRGVVEDPHVMSHCEVRFTPRIPLSKSLEDKVPTHACISNTRSNVFDHSVSDR